MLSVTPAKVRNVVFELCGGVTATVPSPPDSKGTFGNFKNLNVNLPSCYWYFQKYNAMYWGGTPFTTLLMMRDADDVGECVASGCAQRINFKKEGLFDPNQPLFPDMIAGNYEEWTIYNRSFSTHPWHLHQNHVLITKINGVTLPQPEWHDTLLVPAASAPCSAAAAGRRRRRPAKTGGTGYGTTGRPSTTRGPDRYLSWATTNRFSTAQPKHQCGNAGIDHVSGVFQSGHRGLLCRALPCHRP